MGQSRIVAVSYGGLMPGHCFWFLLQVSMPLFKMVAVVTHFGFIVGSEGFIS